MKSGLFCRWIPATAVVLLLLLLSGCAGSGRESDKPVHRRTPANLSAAYEDYFTIGAAVNVSTVDSHRNLILEHFGSITCENEMKPSVAYPRYNAPRLYATDEIADFARENGLVMRGHCFVWHQQAPGWFFASRGGRADRETLLERINDYIVLMTERYGDVVYAWDVVNEAVSDEGPGLLREDSPYYQIIGEDYIAEAFRMARAAAPDARLFYNDYNVLNPGKQDRIFELLETLLADGVPIDGIGIQGHWNVNYPDGDDLVEAIDRFAALGLEVQITELDVSAYEWNDRSHRHGSEPDDRLLDQQARRYAEIFEALRSRSDVVTSVTFWGVADDGTWLDDFPVSNRANWPLLFDEEHRPKPAYSAVVEF